MANLLQLAFKISANPEEAAAALDSLQAKTKMTTAAMSREFEALQAASSASLLSFTQMAIQSGPALSMQLKVIGQIHDALEAAKSPMNDFANAMGKSIEQAIRYKENVGTAMEAAVKATIESLAGRAIAQAIYSTGLGFLDLAEGNFPGAALAFEAAAAFGAVGAAAGAAGAAIPGGRAAGKGSRSGRYSAGSSAGSSGAETGSGYNAQGGAGSSSAPGSALATGAMPSAQPSGGLTVSIMGNEEAGQWLATTLNKAVTQGGVQLVASGSQRGAPVGH